MVIMTIYLVCLIYTLRENAFSLYDLYGHALAQEHLPRVMTVTILVDHPKSLLMYTFKFV